VPAEKPENVFVKFNSPFINQTIEDSWLKKFGHNVPDSGPQNKASYE